MDRPIPGTLLACLCALLCTFTWAAEDSVAPDNGFVISSGAESGGYWSAAERLQAVASDMNFEVENQPSAGSLDNLAKLTDANSPVNLSFAQADALQYYLDKNPGLEEQIDILENIGQECVFIITGINSKIRSDTDLQQNKDLRLGIAAPTSGIAVTFDYMTSQVPEMDDISVSYGDTHPVMEELNTSGAVVDAVMKVHRPKEHSTEVDLALAHPDQYRFVEISDRRLTQKLPNGREIYRAMKLAMPGRENEKPTMVKTICVEGLLLANKQKLSVAQRNQLTDLVSYHWMRVYVTPRGTDQ